jgi:hypothetical protein
MATRQDDLALLDLDAIDTICNAHECSDCPLKKRGHCKNMECWPTKEIAAFLEKAKAAQFQFCSSCGDPVLEPHIYGMQQFCGICWDKIEQLTPHDDYEPPEADDGEYD